MAAVTYELKNKRVFNVLNWKENNNILSLKNEEQEKSSLVHYKCDGRQC